MAIVYFDRHGDVDAVMSVHEADQVTVRRIKNFAYSTFSFHDRSREFTWAGKHGYDDCRVDFYDRGTDTIPVGMVPRLTRYLKEQYPGISVRISKALRDLFTPPRGEVTMGEIEEFAGTLGIHDRETGKAYMPFEHQYRLAYLALNRRRCSLFACTSAGKSLAMMIIARYLVERENRKVLVLVPSTGLVEQLYDNFYSDYGWDGAAEACTLIHGKSRDRLSKAEIEALRKLELGEESRLRSITISTWQSLQYKDDSFFRVFTAVLVDEAHSDRGEKLRGIVEKCVNANDFKVGVSGTLPEVDMRSDPADCIDAGYIEGNLGPKVDVVHLRELISAGVLTPVEVKAVFIPYPQSVRPAICSSKCRYQDELDLMVNNGSRKDVMDMLIGAGRITPDQNTVLLYKGKENLRIMREYLEERHPEFRYYVVEGEATPAERERIRKELEKGPGCIMVATYGCMKQGVNIRLLNNLVFAEPGKSEYMIMQSVGRVVRKHPDKAVATVYDLVDDASYYTHPRGGGQPQQRLNYMMQHYYRRVGYYAKEEIPVEEIHLDGMFEAKLQPEDVRRKKDEAVRKAAERKSGKSGKGAKGGRPAGEYVPKFGR